MSSFSLLKNVNNCLQFQLFVVNYLVIIIITNFFNGIHDVVTILPWFRLSDFLHQGSSLFLLESLQKLQGFHFVPHLDVVVVELVIDYYIVPAENLIA